jgi:hypothetical protein
MGSTPSPLPPTVLETPCREWQGPRNNMGYAVRYEAKKRFGTALVHRQIMILAGHDIEGKVVMHRCDNPPCFRYDHLWVGTLKDNMRDAVAKGRWNPDRSGVRNGGAKLTEDDVRAIRMDPRPRKMIAAEYGISMTQMSRIMRGEQWGWV